MPEDNNEPDLGNSAAAEELDAVVPDNISEPDFLQVTVEDEMDILERLTGRCYLAADSELQDINCRCLVCLRGFRRRPSSWCRGVRMQCCRQLCHEGCLWRWMQSSASGSYDRCPHCRDPELPPPQYHPFDTAAFGSMFLVDPLDIEHVNTFHARNYWPQHEQVRSPGFR